MRALRDALGGAVLRGAVAVVLGVGQGGCSAEQSSESSQAPDADPDVQQVLDELEAEPLSESEARVLVVYATLLRHHDHLDAEEFASAVFDSGLASRAASILGRYSLGAPRSASWPSPPWAGGVGVHDEPDCSQSCEEQTQTGWRECGNAAALTLTKSLLSKSKTKGIAATLKEATDAENSLDAILALLELDYLTLIDLVGSELVDSVGKTVPYAKLLLAVGKIVVTCTTAMANAQLDLEQCRALYPLLCDCAATDSCEPATGTSTGGAETGAETSAGSTDGGPPEGTSTSGDTDDGTSGAGTTGGSSTTDDGTTSTGASSSDGTGSSTSSGSTTASESTGGSSSGTEGDPEEPCPPYAAGPGESGSCQYFEDGVLIALIPWVAYYDEQSEYWDAIVEGTEIGYYASGATWVEFPRTALQNTNGTWSSVLDGTAVWYYEAGPVEREQAYSPAQAADGSWQGPRDGAEFEYDPDGSYRHRLWGPLQNPDGFWTSVIEGVSTNYYPDGSVHFQEPYETYQEGSGAWTSVVDGVLVQYFASGATEWEEPRVARQHLVDGTWGSYQHGTTTGYYESGTVAGTNPWVAMALPDGSWGSFTDGTYYTYYESGAASEACPWAPYDDGSGYLVSHPNGTCYMYNQDGSVSHCTVHNGDGTSAPCP